MIIRIPGPSKQMIIRTIKFFNPLLFEIVAGIGTPAGSCCCCYPNLCISCLFCRERGTGWKLYTLPLWFLFLWWVLQCAFNDWINSNKNSVLGPCELHGLGWGSHQQESEHDEPPLLLVDFHRGLLVNMINMNMINININMINMMNMNLVNMDFHWGHLVTKMYLPDT